KQSREMVLLAASACVFCAIYVVGFFWWAGGWKARKKARHEAASCFMSLLHGSLVTLLTAWDVALHFHQQSLQSKPWQQLLQAPNTPFQDAVVEFSVAYFLVDLLHYALFIPEDALFILHHVASASYMLSCRYYTKHGALSIMLLLGLAECTSFMQNFWTLAFLAGATQTFNYLNVVFLPFFTFVRGFLGPLLTWHLSVYYFSGQADSVIPRWLSFYWMFVVSLAIVGSIFWVARLWARLFAARRVITRANAKSKRLD
ncbi:hypothetical protein GOP47_0020248, partial [Adiantum capillus-veneris]